MPTHLLQQGVEFIFLRLWRHAVIYNPRSVEFKIPVAQARSENFTSVFLAQSFALPLLIFLTNGLYTFTPNQR